MLVLSALDSNCKRTFSGSVNGSNCADLAKKEDIDGFLVGGASLKVYTIHEIKEEFDLCRLFSLANMNPTVSCISMSKHIKCIKK